MTEIVGGLLLVVGFALLVIALVGTVLLVRAYIRTERERGRIAREALMADLQIRAISRAAMRQMLDEARRQQ